MPKKPSNDPHAWDILAERSGAVRFPKIPEREAVNDDEQAAWDIFKERFEKVRMDKYQLEYRHRIAGGFFGLWCSPRLAAQMTAAGKPAMLQQGKTGSFTAADHEFIDLVLSFDAGHWGLLANHVPFAIASGIPTSTVRALRDGKENELSFEDQQVIAFIRGVRDGTVDDTLWLGMVERIGSERGVVELAYFTMHLLMHVRMIQLFDEVQITPDELEDLLCKLERGEYPLPPVTHHGPEDTRPKPAYP